jgi:glycosyltransferase involved in cell wall biosynthesis
MNDQIAKVVVLSDYRSSDPPTQNTVLALARFGYKVFYISHLNEKITNQFVNNLNIKVIYISTLPLKGSLLSKILSLIWYYHNVNRILKELKPTYVIGFMFSPVAYIKRIRGVRYIASILDIPILINSGRLDRIIIKSAFSNLKFWDLVWASDVYKATHIAQLAQLESMPLVCHNCPSLMYFDGYDKAECRKWLINILMENKININDDSIILLRAGAVGEFGAIEETIQLLKKLPETLVFVMMGRPTSSYKKSLLNLISESDLTNRIFMFDQPDDYIWKKIMLGSDIGHLIHIRPSDKLNSNKAKIFDTNSSLSNNRLFQYMAASLPIIAYNDPRMRNIYSEVDCFKIVDTTDLKISLHSILEYLLSQKNQRIKLGSNGKLAYLNKYNWENEFNQIMSFMTVSS